VAPVNVVAGLRAIELNSALDDNVRLTAIVYVLVVVPFWAVTITVTVLLPTFIGISDDRTPLAKDMPLTVMVAPGLLVVGSTVMLEVKFEITSE